jgi:antitoxin component YwqK of YwqJK toxin-antitoxin module
MKKTQGHLLALLIAGVSIGLYGCSKPVLDYRNMQVINGKIYSADANEPFTGTVTNFPDNEILKSQEGFTGFADVVAKAAFPKDPYTPGIVTLNSATTAYCTISVSEGWLDGKASCTAPHSDTAGTQMSFTKGALDGSMTYFNFVLSSHPLSEGTFDGGTPDGKQTVYDPVSGNKVETVHWLNGVLDGAVEVYNATNGEVIKKFAVKDGKQEGAYMDYSPDGKTKLHTAELSKGLKQGDEEFYYPDGKHKEHSEWVEGKLNGMVRRWSEDGKVTEELAYANDVQVLTEADKMRRALSGPVASPAPASIATPTTVPVTPDQPANAAPVSGPVLTTDQMVDAGGVNGLTVTSKNADGYPIFQLECEADGHCVGPTGEAIGDIKAVAAEMPAVKADDIVRLKYVCSKICKDPQGDVVGSQP